MTDRPIIFSGPMVLALLAGRKTQTRRLATSPLRRVEPGDHLYVREAWSIEASGGGSVGGIGEWGYQLEYRCDCATRDLSYVGDYRSDPYMRFYDTQRGDWRPSIHMPRWASRLTLIVEDVRVERLRSMSDEDALAEGVAAVGGRYRDERSGEWHSCTVAKYRGLWNALHAKPGDRWDDDPFCVALTFRVEHGNIDRIAI